MIIESVSLRNFRNYEKADVKLSHGMNLIIGNNAQGKTNFLEAIVYLSLTRSHRINDEKKLIRSGSDFARVECIMQDENEKELEAVIYRQGKTLMIHHQPVKKSSEFIGQLNAVLFSPDDLTIFHDAPGARRKLMNQEISKVSSPYLKALGRYESLLKERNQILKQEQPDSILLDTLDEQMSREEETVIAGRKDFIDCINESLKDLYHQLSLDENTNTDIRYACTCEEGGKESLVHMHQDARERDLQFHTTTCGIQREDMIFRMNEKPLIQYASQGQKRMTVLAFKMALLQYIEKKTGKKPVLLLDDVLSELDEKRQKRLLEMVQEPYQCIITSTGYPAYAENNRIQIFRVKNGTIERAEGDADE